MRVLEVSRIDTDVLYQQLNRFIERLNEQDIFLQS